MAVDRMLDHSPIFNNQKKRCFLFFSSKSDEEQHREICVAVSLQKEAVALQTGAVWFCASKQSVPTQRP